MRATLLIACLSLAACRTSGLGACSQDADCAAGSCDPSSHVCRLFPDTPQITGIAVVTAADFTDSTGRAFFGEGASPLSVGATIAGTSGIDAASVCLRIAGETGSCAHPGTAGNAGTFTFALPRPSASFDGQPLDFTISAASPAGHRTTSAVQHVFFDNQPPGITVAADPAPYARGGASITVTATITDRTGVVSPQLVSGSRQISPGSVSGATYTFSLDPTDAPAGVEGAYAFSITAKDGLNHTASAGASRLIDDAAPALTGLQIFKDAPDGGVISYPFAVPNTGWSGNTFVYSDTVRVKGSLHDVAGVDLATLHVDGKLVDGGVSAGSQSALGCAAGATSCDFDVQIALNDAQNGEFHTGTSDAGVGGLAIPSGFLQVTLETRDHLNHSGSIVTSARTTRFLWQQALASGVVSGLALHPDGDLIVTTDGGTSVYDLAPDQPAVRWSFGSAALGGVRGPPSVGAGSAAAAPIYVAGSDGGILALQPGGGVQWATGTATQLSVGPALVAGATEQVVVPDDVSNSSHTLWLASSRGLTSVASLTRDRFSAPTVLDGGVSFGTDNGIDWHLAPGDGTLGPSITLTGSGGDAYNGIVTDGANLYAATRGGGNRLFGYDSGLAALSWSPSNATINDQPSLGIDGNLLAPIATNLFAEFDPTTGATTGGTVALGGAGHVPVQGSAGRTYVTRSAGFMAVLYQGQTSWIFDPPNTAYRTAMIDCAGRIFMASGSTVYAFVADDRGLANTPWPSMRRDSRNTGNAAALPYGINLGIGSPPCSQ